VHRDEVSDILTLLSINSQPTNQGSQNMQISERDSGNVTILDLSGKVTLGEGDNLLKDKLNSLLHQGKKKVLLNLAQVNYVDSAGLGAIVSAYTTVTRDGGSLKLANVTKRLQDLLSITKLLTVFETFDSEDEGVRSFKN
jgi:anti-sigma B factor antagonist